MPKRLFLAALTLVLGLPAARAQGPSPGVDPYNQSKVPLEAEPPPDFKGKKVVLVAGRQSHGPGEHEFFAGCAVLMDLLKQNGVWPVMARDGWPKNEKVFDGAASLVFFMDGRGGHPVAQGDHLEKLQKYIDHGVGWVNLHYAVDYDPKAGDRVLGWMGGYYDARISINPHWDADFRSLPKHPITRGVKPFVLRDEWYYNMRFVEGRKNVTPILTAIPPDSTRKNAPEDVRRHIGEGRPEVVAWAYDRPAGGRGFGFTGAHFHRNWASEDFRRVVVNAILWTAKVEVPAGGAKVAFDPADLNKNLDKKGKGPFKPIEPPAERDPGAGKK